MKFIIIVFFVFVFILTNNLSEFLIVTTYQVIKNKKKNV